ncbi:MAG TPA: GNAT family protein [Clostridia bacterium]
MTLHSERLLFREFQEADRPLLYQLLSDPVVMRYAYHDAYEAESEFQPYFDRILRNNGTVDRREEYKFAVFLASNHRFVGMCDLEIEQFGESGGNAELGYFLAPVFWGCGYATEIARELLRFGFSVIGMHRVSARCHADNAASENVMKKIGMSREGVFSKARYKNGAWHDELRYAITIANDKRHLPR